MEDPTIGRYACEPHWSLEFGLYYQLVLIFLVIYMAWLSRDLPSAFNETTAIFQSSAIVFATQCFLLMIRALIDKDDLRPDGVSIMQILAELAFVSAIVWLLIYPKIQLAKSEKDFVVNNILGKAYRGKDSGAASHTSGEPSSPSSQSDDAIPLDKGEPPPSLIETELLQLKDQLDAFSRHSFGGKQIELSEWEALVISVDRFHNDLHRIDFRWTDNDEEVHHELRLEEAPSEEVAIAQEDTDDRTPTSSHISSNVDPLMFPERSESSPTTEPS